MDKKKSSKKPFFANLLDRKEQSTIRGGQTHKEPSDNDETSDNNEDDTMDDIKIRVISMPSGDCQGDCP
jgi:hypothetical protein